jgi:hypothetical protein
MRRALVAGLMTLVILLLVPSIADARPIYWYKPAHTPRHGWVVQAGNDSYRHGIRTRCHWYTGSTRWHLSWRIGPQEWYWTASDAGNYGDRAPQGLSCSYVLLW